MARRIFDFDTRGLHKTAQRTFFRSYLRCLLLWTVAVSLVVWFSVQNSVLRPENPTPVTEICGYLAFSLGGAYGFYGFCRWIRLGVKSADNYHSLSIPSVWGSIAWYSPLMALYFFLYTSCIDILSSEFGRESVMMPAIAGGVFFAFISYVGHRRTWVARSQEKVEDTFYAYLQEKDELLNGLEKVRSGEGAAGIFHVLAVGQAGEIQAHLDLEPLESRFRKTPVAVYGGSELKPGAVIELTASRHIARTYNGELLEWGSWAEGNIAEFVETLKVPKYFLLFDRLFGVNWKSSTSSEPRTDGNDRERFTPRAENNPFR